MRYGDTVIEYRVRRLESQSRTARVHVEPTGCVVVDVPAGTDDAQVAAVVRHRAAWIWRHLQASEAQRPGVPERSWVSGESCRYLGRRYMLKIIVDPAGPEHVKLAGGQLQVRVAQPGADRVRELVHRWYDARAADWLKGRVAELAGRLPWVRRPPPTVLRQMKSRWGSCSAKGRLTLNPMLIRAPQPAVDYVITHELCHLRHHNHSVHFYALLGRYVPGWREIKQRLDSAAEGLFAERG